MTHYQRIMSDSYVSKLAIQKGWNKYKAAAWTHLYYHRKRPPTEQEAEQLAPKMVKRTIIEKYYVN